MKSPISPEAVAQMVADRDDVFLIMKRDLYYRPNAQGYTGIKEHAGRYTLEQVAAMFPNMDSPHQDGTEFIRECDAPEYTKACYHDLKEAHQAERLTAIAAENATLRAERDAAQSELDDCLASDWPIWATQIYNTLKEFGYRYDHFDGIDLPEDVSEFLRGFPENAASELMEQRDDALQELATLRASEAAANARAEQARDAALVEAAARFPDHRHPWPPHAIREAILALRDKPAPGMQEGA